MRKLPILFTALLLAGCSTPAEQARYDAESQAKSDAKLSEALAGKVAGRPQNCLPTFRSQDMIRIDDDTVLFRDGASRVYRNELNGHCNGLGSSNYALVTKSIGSGNLCEGDIARVVDISTGTMVGSCSLGEFVPYTRTTG